MVGQAQQKDSLMEASQEQEGTTEVVSRSSRKRHTIATSNSGRRQGQEPIIFRRDIP